MADRAVAAAIVSKALPSLIDPAQLSSFQH